MSSPLWAANSDTYLAARINRDHPDIAYGLERVLVAVTRSVICGVQYSLRNLVPVRLLQPRGLIESLRNCIDRCRRFLLPLN